MSRRHMHASLRCTSEVMLVSCMAGHHVLAFVHMHKAWRQRANYQWPKPSLRHAFPICYHRGESLLFGHLGAQDTGEDSSRNRATFANCRTAAVWRAHRCKTCRCHPHTQHTSLQTTRTPYRLHDCMTAGMPTLRAPFCFLTSLARLRCLAAANPSTILRSCQL
jgi:hypothetical protein